MKKLITCLLAMIFLTAGSLCQAQGNGPKHGPPPEAYAACKGKKVGDSASLKGRQGETVTGTCEEHNGRLFLIPDNPPEHRGGQGSQ